MTKIRLRGSSPDVAKVSQIFLRDKTWSSLTQYGFCSTPLALSAIKRFLVELICRYLFPSTQSYEQSLSVKIFLDFYVIIVIKL